MLGVDKMVHVFWDKRGVGKTKALISMANEKVLNSKGNAVYIDDDYGPCYILDRRIRFVAMGDFDSFDSNGFYGFLCGIISENYDIDTIYIDGLFNVVKSSVKDIAHLFYNIEKLSLKNRVDFFINVNGNNKEVPDFIKKYVKEYALA